MKFGSVPLSQAAGKLLAHNVPALDGRKLFTKSHQLTPDDVETLRAMGLTSVVVAELEADDLSENEAARRVGVALAGSGVRVVAPGVGRANLSAEVRGVLNIDVSTLHRVNQVDEGITVATLRRCSVVQARQLLALVKIIPFAMPQRQLEAVEAIIAETGKVITLTPLEAQSIALIVSGPDHMRDKLLAEFTDPVRTRMETLGSQLEAITYVPHQPSAIAAAIQAQHAAKRGLIILAGISAIIDRGDVAPTGLVQAGGEVEHFGAPVDPGSLLMLGYLHGMPVLGAPGCIKSLKVNIIDWIVPRLLTGEHLTGRDIMLMGHGGLLDDIEDRPMPRHREE
ncbi:MAG: molybdopterin-binding protein [Anaerolineae bacterium]|nr:molybdopterin-binding protein [Anaerolineae bacterium]